jgi:Rod binding domain-containing protein
VTSPAVSAAVPEFSQRALPTGRQSATLPNTAAALKLRKAAAEFESMLLAELWKSMSSFASEDDDSTDPAHGTLQDLGIRSMCSAVSKTGGLGLGKLILKHLEPLLNASQNGNTSKAFPPPADTTQ